MIIIKLKAHEKYIKYGIQWPGYAWVWLRLRPRILISKLFIQEFRFDGIKQSEGIDFFWLKTILFYSGVISWEIIITGL